MLSRGYVHVNSPSLPQSSLADAPIQSEPARKVEAWRTLLAQCARKPSRKSVHGLRSLTLRLQVELGYRLGEQPAESATARAFRRWVKQGKKLRKALEPVRNADVYLARLGALRNLLAGTREGEAQLSPRCQREVERLETRLKRERQAGIGRLRTFLEQRGKRLSRLSRKMEMSLKPDMHGTASCATHASLEIFSRLSSEFPDLDGANLHEYRKGLKRALYLAEVSAPADPLAARLAAAFRKIHLAAGEWHDLEALAQVAGRVLRGHGKPNGLIPVLNSRADQALHRALGLRRRTAARFLKSPAETLPAPPRKPVVSDTEFAPDGKSAPLKISA